MTDYYSEDCAVCKHWQLPVIGNSTKFFHIDICHKTIQGYCYWLRVCTDNDFTCDGFYRRGKARKKKYKKEIWNSFHGQLEVQKGTFDKIWNDKEGEAE